MRASSGCCSPGVRRCRGRADRPRGVLLEAGRALCPTIVHSTLQAAVAIQLLGGPDQHAAWLPLLSSGKLCATTSLWNTRNAAVIAPTLHAQIGGADAWRLGGTVDFVADADLADYLVASATDGRADRGLRRAVGRRRSSHRHATADGRLPRLPHHVRRCRGGGRGTRCWRVPTMQAWRPRTCGG